MNKITIPDDSYMEGFTQVGAKRIHAQWASGRALFFVSHLATSSGYLVDCLWTIYDYGTAVVLGCGRTKAEALSQAREAFKNRRSLVKHFVKGRAQIAAYWARVNAGIEDFESFRRHAAQATNISPKRQRVFLQSDGKCHYCKTELSIDSGWQMDHYISRSNGGRDHLDNLVAACTPCNQRKGKLNGDEFQKHLEIIAKRFA